LSKKEIYKWMKLAGILSYIPLLLVAGPLAGFLFGSFLERKFGFSSYVTVITAAAGFLMAVAETVRLIRIALKAERKV
jgi:hypothetical protein